MTFQNRTSAGKLLAGQLQQLLLFQPIVLAIPRGGVPVGAAIAQALACPYDVIPLVKLPIPWNPEASYGVVAMDGVTALNRSLVDSLELSEHELELMTHEVLDEAKRRDLQYRQGKPFPDLRGATVIIADDGMASGYSMLAALRFVKKRGPDDIIVATPVTSETAQRMIQGEPGVTRLITFFVNVDPYFSLASYYDDFRTPADDEIVRTLFPA